jgi:peptidoglycan endopeptidase LytE
VRKLIHTVLIIAAANLLLLGCQASVRFTSSSAFKTSARQTSYRARSNNNYSNYSNSKTPVIQKITPVSDPVRNKILKEAQKWLGTPYCWGGQNKRCTDCSGFVLEIFKSCGISLPRTAERQFFYSQAENNGDISPADLVFFRKNGNITHVGIYAGDNNFIHASSSDGVKISSLNKKYYRDHFAGFGKIF